MGVPRSAARAAVDQTIPRLGVFRTALTNPAGKVSLQPLSRSQFKERT